MIEKLSILWLHPKFESSALLLKTNCRSYINRLWLGCSRCFFNYEISQDVETQHSSIVQRQKGAYCAPPTKQISEYWGKSLFELAFLKFLPRDHRWDSHPWNIAVDLGWFNQQVAGHSYFGADPMAWNKKFFCWSISINLLFHILFAKFNTSVWNLYKESKLWKLVK